MSTTEELRSILKKARVTDRGPNGGVPRWRTLEPALNQVLGTVGLTKDQAPTRDRELVKDYIDEKEIHVGSSGAFSALLGDASSHLIEEAVKKMEAAEAEAGGAAGAKAGGGRKRRKSKKRKSKKRKSKKRKSRTRRRRR